ncbi:MAG TPA: NIPSNAP family protein [Candidatus Dormibacteraeota bacterium]|nr:NIPSNAP family protein [Candidatus Dormibacteraeota bacterium]
MLFELRQYRVREGQRDSWVRLMEEAIIPFQSSQGMVIVGSFVAEEEPDLYVWIRRFEDEQDRERLYDAVYQSEHWKDVIAPRVSELLDREQITVTRLNPTAKSVLR